MNKNIRIFRKYAAIFALAISAIMFLPVVSFAQGAVIGYACGDQILPPLTQQKIESYPSNEQLDNLTHVIAMDMFPDANGNLRTKHMFNRNINTVWDGVQTDSWLLSLVQRAQDRGVTVSIGIAGLGTAIGIRVGEFISATTNDPPTKNRDRLVGEIAKFVKAHNLNGIDLD